MKCTRVQDLLKSDYLDAELHQELRRQVDSHLKKCPACQTLKQSLRDQRISLRAIKQKEVPPEIWQNIQSTIIEERLKEPDNILGNTWEGLKRAFSMPRPAFALAGTMAVVILALFLGQTIIGKRQPLTVQIANETWEDYQINGETYTYNFGTTLEEYFL